MSARAGKLPCSAFQPSRARNVVFPLRSIQRQTLRAAFAAQGVQLKIAVVEGDDLSEQAEALRAEGIAEMFSGAPMPAKLLSINAYLGAQPIDGCRLSGARSINAVVFRQLRNHHHFRYAVANLNKPLTKRWWNIFRVMKVKQKGQDGRILFRTLYRLDDFPFRVK